MVLVGVAHHPGLLPHLVGLLELAVPEEAVDQGDEGLAVGVVELGHGPGRGGEVWNANWARV